MPRYFFHTGNGGRKLDDVGLELADIATARKEAIRFAGALLNEDPDLLWNGEDFRVEVTDSANRLIVTVIIQAVDAAIPI